METKIQATINLMLPVVIRYSTRVICAYANERVYMVGVGRTALTLVQEQDGYDLGGNI